MSVQEAMPANRVQKGEVLLDVRNLKMYFLSVVI